MSAENTKVVISTLRSLPLKYEIIVSNDLEQSDVYLELNMKGPD